MSVGTPKSTYIPYTMLFRSTEKITDKVLKVVERIARNDVEKTILGSTAECSALFHQPKRPKKKEN